MPWGFCTWLHPPGTPPHTPRPPGAEEGAERKGERAVLAALRQRASPGAAGGAPPGAEVADRCSRAHVTRAGPRRGSRGWGGSGGRLPPGAPWSPTAGAAGALRLGVAGGWLFRAPVPSGPAWAGEEAEGEEGDAKVGQECNWTLRTHYAPPSPPPLRAGAADASLGKRVVFAVVVPQHCRWTVTRGPGGMCFL